MAQLQMEAVSATTTKQKTHAALKIDMTPMVDLGFLLITFFIFTTTMAEKKGTRLIMPKEGPPVEIKNSHALTALLSNDKIYVYEGNWEEALRQNKIIASNYNEYKGLGNLIRQKQMKLQQTDPEGKNALIFLIKPLKQATYKNLVDALDEVTINDVKKYAIVNATTDEIAFAGK